MKHILGPTKHIHYHGLEEPPLLVEGYDRSRLIGDTSDNISEEHRELTYMTTFLLTEDFQLSFENPTGISEASATNCISEACILICFWILEWNWYLRRAMLY